METRGRFLADTIKFLIPFVDLINHDRVEGVHNFVRLAAAPGEEERGPAFIELVRGQDSPVLRRGEEVHISYGDGQQLTPDETLAYYGFVEKAAAAALIAPQPAGGGAADAAADAAAATGTELCTIGTAAAVACL